MGEAERSLTLLIPSVCRDQQRVVKASPLVTIDIMGRVVSLCVIAVQGCQPRVLSSVIAAVLYKLCQL